MNVYKMIRTIIVTILLLVATVSCGNNEPTWSTSTSGSTYTVVYVNAPGGAGCIESEEIIFTLQDVLDDYKHRGYRPLSITTTTSTSMGFHCGYIILMEYVGDDYLP